MSIWKMRHKARLSYTHYYFVLKYLFQHHGYLHALDFQPCLIWSVSWGILSWGILSWGILSWGYFWSSMSPTSLEGVPKLSDNISSCSLTRYIVCSFQPPQGFTIFSCHWVFNRTTAHQAALLLISWLFPKFPIFLGFYGVPRNTALWLQATSWEVWSLPYFILVLWRRRFWWADLLLSNGVFSIDIFPCVLWDVEDKV